MKQKSAFFILLLITLFVNALGAATIHAFLIYDTVSEDIRETVKIDQRQFEGFLKIVKDNTKAELKTHRLSGTAVQPYKISRLIQKTDIRKDDIVIFYYSGHGFHPISHRSPWPAIPSSVDMSYLTLETVIKQIRTKNPRFALVFSDSCNNYLPGDEVASLMKQRSRKIAKTSALIAMPRLKANESPFVVPKSHARLSSKEIADNYKNLFLQQKGIVVAVGAERGGYSLSDEQIGGFFTYSLIMHFKHGVGNYAQPDWSAIMDMSGKAVIQFQKTFFKITG